MPIDPHWQINPIQVDYSDMDVQEHSAGINQKIWDVIKNDPLSLNREEDFRNMRSYIDIETGGWMRGVMEKSLAYSEQMGLG